MDGDSERNRPSWEREDTSARIARALSFSMPVSRVYGIRIRLHWSCLVVMLLCATWTAAGGTALARLLWGTLHTLILYTLVLIHELCHAAVAAMKGRSTDHIVLTPLGGAAVIDGAMRNPGMEAEVALAGPASNLVILALTVPLSGVFGMPVEWQGPGVAAALGFAFRANLLLALFNLLPAFPLDGGRVLRALLSWRRGERRGTRFAARAGEVAGVLFVALGIWVTGHAGWILAGIGIFNIFACEMAIRHLDLGCGVYEQTAWEVDEVSPRRESREERRAREAEELHRRVDALLDKVSRQGMGSLTRREKAILKKASKMYRRTDR